MRVTGQSFALAVWLLALIGCRREEQAALPFPLVADGKPAITVHLEPTYINVTSRKTGAYIIPGVEIYSGGGCVIRDFDGTELERRISQQQLAELLRFFDAERIFGLTDRAVDEAVARDTAAAPDPAIGLWLQSTPPAGWVAELVIPLGRLRAPR